MERVFVYGTSVEGNNFTDREEETKRLKLNFENGINVILISPRRMGKSSIVKKVKSQIDKPGIMVVNMDIYDCRSEYDFYNRFAAALIKETSSKSEQVLENIKRFLIRLTPKISFSPDPTTEFSLSLGITPQNYQPEEILQLPELIAKEKGMHLVVCIDEFQQIGEFNDTITVQKRLRSIWQHQRNVSYCLYGSKKHLMTNLFQNRKMPFYQFGEMIYLDKIPTEKWVPFICERFKSQGKTISKEFAKNICDTVENCSSYVQQLAWNVFAETKNEVTTEDFKKGENALISQCSGLFEEQIKGLTSYQLNFIRAICNGIHSNFGHRDIIESYNFGAKSNISRIIDSLLNRELIEVNKDGIYIEDPVFRIWFKQNYLNI